MGPGNRQDKAEETGQRRVRADLTWIPVGRRDARFRPGHFLDPRFVE